MGQVWLAPLALSAIIYSGESQYEKRRVLKMKQRRMAQALVLLLCVSAFLSGALLILHSGHDCHQAACPVCAIWTRGTESFLCLLFACTGMGLVSCAAKYRLLFTSENRFSSDGTLVHRKVKLLN